MSTIDGDSSIPTGTYAADTVHSTLGVRGAVRRRDLPRRGARVRRAAGRRPPRPAPPRSRASPSRRRTSRRTSSPPSSSTPTAIPVVSFAGDLERTGDDTVERDGEVTIKGITQPARSRARSSARPSTTSAPRASAWSSTTVDRTAFGMTWNMPLPNGEPALGNEVTLKADLTLVAQEA